MNFCRLALLPMLLGVALSASAQRYRTEPLQKAHPFSLEEATEIMGIGDAALKGRASATFKRGLMTASTTLYARDQVAFLLPMTRFMRAWVTHYAANGGLRFGQIDMHRELDHVAARVLTDAEGRFTFRGLKPGQYLLVVPIPYEADTEREVETGRYVTRTWSSWGIVTAAVREPVSRTVRETTKLENHVIHVVNIPEGQRVVDLGEVQGEKASPL